MSDDGLAEVDQAALSDSSAITLQGWGKIEGTLTLDDKPGVDEQISVQPQSESPVINRNVPSVMYQFYIKTDAAGKFSFDHVPPGNYSVSRREDVPVNQPGMRGNVFTMRMTLTEQVTVSAGETAKVSLGKPADGQ